MIQRNINQQRLRSLRLILESYRFIDSDATVYLRNSHSNQYVGLKDHPSYQEGYSCYPTRMLVDKNESIAVRLSRATNSEITECNFLMSCRPFVKHYLKHLVHFDALRKTESAGKPNDLLYAVLKINWQLSTILETLDRLEKYALNQILVETQRLGRDSRSNRKKILSELDFIEMFCGVLNLYFDYKDLDSLRDAGEESLLTHRGTQDGSLLPEDLAHPDAGKDSASLKKLLNKHYSRYVRNGNKIFQSIYSFLAAMVEHNEANQRSLFKYLFCFQKHFAYFEASLDLALVMVQDNQFILGSLAEGFFESLNIVKDLLTQRDKRRYIEVDVEITDKHQYLYHEFKDGPRDDQDESRQEEDADKLVFQKGGKTARSTNLLVYLLILLSRRIRSPKILRLLAVSCLYKGSQFVPNQDNFVELLSENDKLVLLFFSDFRVGNTTYFKKLVNRFEEENSYITMRSLFQKKLPTSPVHEMRYKYLIELVNFYAAICSGRNLKWKTFASKLFPEVDLRHELVEPGYPNGTRHSLRPRAQLVEVLLHAVHRS